jgi:hypothetical protein
VQFHVEVGATTIEEWAAVAEYEASLAAVGGGDAAWLADQVTCHLDTMRAAATAILSGVLNAVPGRSLPTEAAS